MTESLLLNELKSGFSNHVDFYKKRPGVVQVVAPLFHEDGDMIDIFIDLPQQEGEAIKVSDHGLTLMRLSYTFDIDTPARRKIFDKILAENGVLEERGRLSISTTPGALYPALLQLAQTISKVSNLTVFNREVVQSLFYEDLGEFVAGQLSRYHPEPSFRPLPSRDDIEVDWRFDVLPRNIYLFGVRGSTKARLAALTCRELQIAKVSHRSVIVHEDFENGLGKKDQSRITNAADKQFASLADFKGGAEQFFEREVEQSTIN